MSVAPARGGLVNLFKRGWNEIPEVVGSTAFAFIGVGMAVYGLMNYYAKDGDNRRYKSQPVILRPDDPRAAKVHKD